LADDPEQSRDQRHSKALTGRHEDQTLTKANEAIALRPKRGKLTLLSLRIYNVFIYHAQQQGVDSDKYTILLSDLIDDARFNSNNTQLLKSHIRDMQATTIEWQTGPAGKRRWDSTQLLGPATIEEQGRGRPCTITWTFPEPIREKLIRPSQYTRVLLELSSQMRSYAAAVLFEIGARYLTSPSRLTMREDVLWWASVLTGRSDITKVDYRILHRDTIKKALVELDALSPDFRLEVIEHKRGRKVEELQFQVVPKAQRSLEPDVSAKNTFDLHLVERIIALGFKKPDAQDLYAATDEGVLRAALDHVEARMHNTSLPPLKSAVAYLKDAVKKSYAGSAPEPEKDLPPPQIAMSERLERLREDWRYEKSQEAKKNFESMPETRRRECITAFEEQRLSELPSPIARSWRKEGVNSLVASSSFFRWLAVHLWTDAVTDKELLEFAVARSA